MEDVNYFISLQFMEKGWKSDEENSVDRGYASRVFDNGGPADHQF